VGTTAGRWLPGTVTAKEQSGYRVIYMGCESDVVGAMYLKPCSLMLNESVEVFTKGSVWVPGTIVAKSEEPEGYQVKLRGNEAPETVGTYCLRRCTLMVNESVEVFAGDGSWLPGCIVAESTDPVGYEVRYEATQQGVIGTYAIRRCKLKINESVEVYAGEAGWLPGTILAESADPAGYEVKFDGSAQQVVGTHCIRRCQLLPNESVEVFAGEAGWFPATVVSKSEDPIGYEVSYRGSSTSVIAAYSIRRCTLMINESVEVYAGAAAGWLPGTVRAQSSDPVGYEVTFNGSQQQVISASAIKRCKLVPNEKVEVFAGGNDWLAAMVVAKSDSPIGYTVRLGDGDQVVGAFCIRRAA